MIALRYAKSSYDAQDILQNGLVKIFQGMKSFDPNLGQFSSWSNKIIVNECLLFFRNQRQSFSFDEINEDNLSMELDERNEHRIDAQTLTKMIQKLPNGYRVVFNLFAIEGMTHAEIGQILNIKESTSKSQYFKAKKLLKSHLEVII